MQDKNNNYTQEDLKIYPNYNIEQYKAQCQVYITSYTAIIELSKMALRGAFILNGTAAIALLYSPKVPVQDMQYALLCFALGALFSVICSGMAYVTQYFTSGTWSHFIEQPHSCTKEIQEHFTKLFYLSTKTAKYFHITSIFTILMSYISFGIGIYFSYILISNI